ncbi:60S acidic ribosomal protein P2 [Culex quinquefasciatus]|uniref:Large ribosomal subunit protein P2 n=1 Tax=Culex quinquefasciatus TaxID=7176 RepID=B0WHC4_CULQU|nr:60S acidic ribosomal protein P2 [Culex quinquefasciatus]|eukprot:XP_001848108.1 60S acidic ribosomal protein P2 [Culex quinquefasciatus]
MSLAKMCWDSDGGILTDEREVIERREQHFDENLNGPEVEYQGDGGKCRQQCGGRRRRGSTHEKLKNGAEVHQVQKVSKCRSVGLEADSTRINKEVIELKGKSIGKLIASGREKLSSMSSGGAVPAIAAED